MFAGYNKGMRNAYLVLGIGMLVMVAVAWYGGAHARPSASTSSAMRPIPVNPKPMTPAPTPAFTLTSSAFKDGATIPAVYTCDGTNTPPPLSISGIPEGTKSLALVMQDPDVPKQLIPEGVFVHWVLYNIPPDGTVKGMPGGNSRDDLAYTGPCPPPEYEPSTHRYIFTLYALSGTLTFVKAPTAKDVEGAVAGMTIAKTELIGTYSRK